MSSRLPRTTARESPENLAILLREAFVVLNDLAVSRLAERGHGAVRPAHGAVFQYLDDAGTTVSVLADRARMTKQSMAELVRHLETHGYVRRIPDPADRRAKLVQATDRGLEVFAIVRELVTDTEHQLNEALGARRMSRLRDDLEAVRQTVAEARTPSG
jgi:DNA-binding MarR family transcriptional regulator